MTALLDNRWSLSRGRLHLTFRLGDRTIAYAYIRKNGCSTFKQALGYTWDQRIDAVSEAYPYGPHDIAIFVYRCPMDRLVSIWRNKILTDAPHAADLQADYRSTMGEAPTCFERFCDYAARGRDPHLWPQSAHLKRLRYRPIALARLYEDMCDLVGRDAAAPFRHRANVSRKAPVQITERSRSLVRKIYAADYKLVDACERLRNR
ncbi:sulfotransferase family 2 domain-containing protein [Oceanomicrobium pacificus]|uniref:Sulfotransferase family 2 domain-containing protein n=1 Tax=Oceanomicrobium pacificus TaxID=2692916 RepID=A0A6B0U072_9RHOB|nr:sulfotransferase family 2 domain-containing protein [Oceanomicrobium pacificus]MXU64541.1 sulfotransferase family 2 domain-containing protein [Oceanomicrobium pacificus]